jgi:hypothetical protein
MNLVDYNDYSPSSLSSPIKGEEERWMSSLVKGEELNFPSLEGRELKGG